MWLLNSLKFFHRARPLICPGVDALETIAARPDHRFPDSQMIFEAACSQTESFSYGLEKENNMSGTKPRRVRLIVTHAMTRCRHRDRLLLLVIGVLDAT